MELKISDISLDPDLQPRVGGLDPTHIRSLEETPDAWPPVVVVKQGSVHLLTDGFHRLAAAQNLGLETVRAELIEPPADGDLRSLAFSLNLRHGRPLSLQDRRAYAEHILRTRPELSDRAIGEMTALSGNTVTAIRRELEATAQIERPTARLGRGGYSYREADRQPGDLPEPSFGEGLGNVVAGLFSSADRQRQRKWASYVQRVVAALEDQFALPGWEEAPSEDIAEACRLVLGAEKASAIGQRLGESADSLVQVAQELGYTPEEDNP